MVRGHFKSVRKTLFNKSLETTRWSSENKTHQHWILKQILDGLMI